MISTALKLNKALKENETIKEYLTLKETLKQNKEVNDLLNSILNTQKDLKEAIKNNDIKIINECKRKIVDLKTIFFNNPLIVNYMTLKEETLRIVEQVSNIIGD